MRFACLGDSITSDQVTGIGTLVAQKLGFELVGNFATGYATCTDWYAGDNSISRITLETPQNTNTDDNVLANQVRRLLQAVAPVGQPIRWTMPDGRTYTLPEELGLGLGKPQPDVIYIAIGTNDGNQRCNAPFDDTDVALSLPYHLLDRVGMASALRWALLTLRAACPHAMLCVATPLQANTDQPWMSFAATLMKRNIICRVCSAEAVDVIDSCFESGFNMDVALDHGGVHPDDEWKEIIADYVAERIGMMLA